MTSQGERRRKERKRPLSLVYVELANANGGMMRDLSTDGFAVRAMMPIRGGEKTPFTFSLNENVKIEGEGQILWIEEGGRVAGVQFISISEQARAQIQEWLVRPETAPAEEPSPEKAEAAKNATLEQLREEMHSVPPRPEGVTPMEAPAVASAASESVQTQTASSPAGSSWPHDSSEMAAKPEAVPEPLQPLETEEPTGEPVEEPVAPALPRISLTPKVVVPIRRNRPPSPPWREPPASREPWKSGAADTLPPEQEGRPEQPQHKLPDISSILMQPPGKTPPAAAHMSPVETLASWSGEPPPRESWTERLSLSNAITVMVFLAMLAGLYVFHREVGQRLIWLGEAMGGIPDKHVAATQMEPPGVPQTTAPASTAEGAAPQSSSTPSSPALPQPETSSATPPAQTPGNSNGSPGTNVGSSSPTVTPLSGMAPTGNTEGQAEYDKAMQILHSRNASVDAPEALRLLWISVEKGNLNAELELADMYWRGRGVIQNCDQTLILLTAAARKGSAEAQKRLLQYRKQGCE
jgi:hypothetical protein